MWLHHSCWPTFCYYWLMIIFFLGGSGNVAPRGSFMKDIHCMETMSILVNLHIPFVFKCSQLDDVIPVSAAIVGCERPFLCSSTVRSHSKEVSRQCEHLTGDDKFSLSHAFSEKKKPPKAYDVMTLCGNTNTTTNWLWVSILTMTMSFYLLFQKCISFSWPEECTVVHFSFKQLRPINLGTN